MMFSVGDAANREIAGNKAGKRAGGALHQVHKVQEQIEQLRIQAGQLKETIEEGAETQSEKLGRDT